MSRKLKVDRELQELLPPLDQDQRDSLKALIRSEGCQDSIKVWKGKGIIVDGHHRYAICNELKCDFKVTEMAFADKGDAAEWMVTHQDARRNSTPAAISTARGMAYNLRKQKQGGDRKNTLKPREKSKGQVDPLISIEAETAAKVAGDTGVSPSTIKRDGKFQESLSKLTSKARESILAGDVRKPTQEALDRLGEYDSSSQVTFVSSVKSGEFKTVTAALDAEEKPAKGKVELSPEEQAKANRKLAMDYIAKAVNAVDSYHAVKA